MDLVSRQPAAFNEVILGNKNVVGSKTQKGSSDLSWVIAGTYSSSHLPCLQKNCWYFIFALIRQQCGFLFFFKSGIERLVRFVFCIPPAGVDQYDRIPVCSGWGVPPATQHPWSCHIQPTHGALSRAQTLHDLHGALRHVQPFGLDCLLHGVCLQWDTRQPLLGPSAVPFGVWSWQSWSAHSH